MADPFEKVASGQPLTIKADTWNYLLDNAKDNRRQRGAQGTELGKYSLTPSMRVLVENGTGGDLDEFSVVQVTDPAVIPIPPVPASSGVSDNRFDVLGRPLFEAVDVDDPTCGYAILTEPILDGGIGIAIMGGMAVVTVDIVNESHKFADVETGSYNLKSSETGRALIIHKASAGTGDKLCVVHVEQIPQGGLVPVSADCSIQINACPIPKYAGNVAGVFTLSDTTFTDAVLLPAGGGITVEYQGWCGPISAASWSSGTATITAVDHPLAIADTVTISGVDPSGYNVTGTVASVSGDTFTIVIASDPGTYLAGGIVSAPTVTYCVDNPDTCCDEGTVTYSVPCCTPYKLIVPTTLYVKITNTTGDAVGMPASTAFPGWVGTTPLQNGTPLVLYDVSVSDPFSFFVELYAGCAYISATPEYKPAVQVLMTSGSTLTLTTEANWPERIFNEGALYNVESPVRLWTCTGADITWAPGASEAICSVSVSYDGGLTESASFDLAIGTTP